MATQPLSREDAIYTLDSDLPIELQLVSPSIRKTSARKASAKTTASKTTAGKITTPKASTATKSKTVAKTATTRHRAVTKFVPIEDFSTSDFSTSDSLVRSLPIQAPSQAPSQAHGILSQLQICRQSLIALQSQSQELHHRMAALTTIAQQMDELQPSRIAEFVESEIVEKTAAKNPASQNRSAAVSQDSKNYWGSEPAVTAAIASIPVSMQTRRRKSEPCLPNLNPSSIAETLEIPVASVGLTAAPSAVSPSAVQTPAVKPSFQSSGLSRSGISGFPTHRVSQHAEYYRGSLVSDHDPRPIAKPSQLMRSKPSQLTSQTVHKPVSQFVSKSIAQLSTRSVTKPISNSVVIAIAAPIVPTAGNLIQQLIPIPKGEGAIMLDALCWTLSAIGVRMSCHLLTQLVPLLTLPLTLFMLSPAIIATYLAFCVPKSSSATVYRCLLITLGFFIGGKI